MAWTEADLQGARRLLDYKLQQRRTAEAEAQAKLEVEQVIKGIAQGMLNIPGGTFQMGCSPGDDRCQDNEQPPHKVTVSPFRIAKYTAAAIQAAW
ncbi:SUMF1/EgtB/PvdO family nonheme iron enzyme [uncultured Thiodictyon sp.]|uniref:formylglycine-generating enzyme family protein n=1 Tax=uncultured Thiodictyon sp. TaxID=1846217 RepID=UPI0025F5295F|nr:SUMF1/EgtB/PvdO family nonheme iron enzyme [uncultured Thiodictyon sp.]